MAAKASERRTRRPAAVTLVAWLHVLEGVVLLVGGSLDLLRVVTPIAEAHGGAVSLADLWPDGLVAALYPVVGLLALIAAVGLFRMRAWAWLLAMAIQGLGLANALSDRLLGSPDYLSMALGVFIVLLLNQGEVRRAFPAPERAR